MISVIIPVFNASETLIKCLNALESQILKPGEVILIDDGSSDSTLRLLSDFRIKSKLKINIFKQKHLGPGAARNLGAKKASGEILAFIDSDCIPDDKWLKKIKDAFSNKKIGAVGGGYCAGVDNSFWQRFSCEELKFRRRRMKKFVDTALSNNLACRKDLFWEVGGFPKEYPVCEDMLLTYRISRMYKLLWLKNNGIVHHFKKNLVSFLRHQYFFGKQSTRFFLDNPGILKDGNHQGRELHLAIASSIFSLLPFTAYYLFLFFGNDGISKIFLLSFIFFILLHLFIYLNFIFYLKKRKFSGLDLARVYIVSYIRDIIAAISFFTGLVLYIKKRKP